MCFQALHAWYEDELQEPEQAAAPGAAANNGVSPAKRRRAGNASAARGPSAPKDPAHQAAGSSAQRQAAESELVPDSDSEGAGPADDDDNGADTSRSADSEGVCTIPFSRNAVPPDLGCNAQWCSHGCVIILQAACEGMRNLH